MSREEQQSREGLHTSEQADGGPGAAYMTFVVMEELLDKLKLLRHYFALQTNPGEQFYLFTSLAAWLIRKTGRPFEQPQEYDDPNSTISSILDSLRQLGVSVDFPPNKLKQGFGEHALFVLDHLADAALKSTNFMWKKPELVVEVEEEDDEMEDESELLLEKVEEEMAAEVSDEEEETLLHIDDLQNLRIGNKTFTDSQKPDDILESTTNIDGWKLELERVLPQLKVTIKTDAQDWRTHLEQMQRHRSGIDEALATAKGQLDKLHSDIELTLEKISSREKFLNSQLEPLLDQYRALQDEFARINEQYREVSGGVTERSRILAQVTEELESVKQEMDERGSSMTDGTPLVNIKKAISQIKSEITAMDVRVGVLEHSLLQARLRDKNLLHQDMNAPLHALV
ncbi:Intraflagellar transport protein 57-like protein [Cryptotermes secundus]|uniref:Intraflagellar transport protein 57-like protein n=1 Tax=Cryptotermes secundus TaxID=105785 RepID=A0A2J7Q8B5_9NEOP|nr:intraflagellar transport protein 57 homolog isoform X2 [Cryptotermes secundus]PNF24819.1 Intraflagellar transport protein 57-like protein [Cryptotermes secundus]